MRGSPRIATRLQRSLVDTVCVLQMECEVSAGPDILEPSLGPGFRQY